MTRLRILLGVHLLFFALWGGWLVMSHRGAAEIWLETSPVDPRDLLSGHFVALRFEQLENPTGPECLPDDLSDTIFLRLIPSGRIVETAEGAREVWTVGKCSPLDLSEGGQTWIRGSRPNGVGRFHFGIERFYVPEGSPLRSARSGQVIAKIAVNREHQGRILGLVVLKKGERE